MEQGKELSKEIRELELKLKQLKEKEKGVKTTTDSCTTNIPEEDLTIKTNQEPLGSGGFGKVYKGILKPNTDVAVKVFKTARQQDFMKEIRVSQSLKPHPNVVQYFGSSLHEGELCLVMELIKPGALRPILIYDCEKGNRYAVAKLKQITLQIMSGVQHLHRNNIVHGDLCLRNVLVEGDISRSNEWKVKLTDFGFGKILNPSLEENDEEDNYYRPVSLEQVVVPVKWSAIEVIERAKYSYESDIWSLGVVVWEVFEMGRAPWSEVAKKDILETIKNGNRLSKPQDFSDELYNILLRCWEDNRQKRIKLPDLINAFRQGLENVGEDGDEYDYVSIPVSNARTEDEDGEEISGDGGEDEGVEKAQEKDRELQQQQKQEQENKVKQQTDKGKEKIESDEEDFNEPQNKNKEYEANSNNNNNNKNNIAELSSSQHVIIKEEDERVRFKKLELIKEFGKEGSAEGEFDYRGPKYAAIDFHGQIFVSDTFNDRIQVFSQTGTFLRAILISKPTGILISHFGGTIEYLLVALSDRGCVAKLDKETGKELMTIGTQGRGSKELMEPEGITLDKQSSPNVYVCDYGNGRIQIYNCETGQFKASLGVDYLKRPIDVAITKRGQVLVSDITLQKLQVYDVQNGRKVKTVIWFQSVSARGIGLLEEDVLFAGEYKEGMSGNLQGRLKAYSWGDGKNAGGLGGFGMIGGLCVRKGILVVCDKGRRKVIIVKYGDVVVSGNSNSTSTNTSTTNSKQASISRSYPEPRQNKPYDGNQNQKIKNNKKKWWSFW